ncbi:ABC transporter ATP-binding protein [Clostridium botulinum]|uniref:ABC transporter ATP-binding protein n=1 Tax=Clostridium botulinum TaxID=1491 RepID=A0A0M1LU00_CLOBO|nr:ABC transporter ATP-binding protein [Clostridium botulinum]KAI3349772.1 ABC transporter ATP-binding protein/permease [Clostridium botulinum]KOM89475.1 multidrug ABC transporter ATP-binding protein [Clostridium botulinum]KOR61144.1 multidrug ABC transporter ATP-binding protein [Clostridium botulinum]MBN1074219.1 ABC transporter ATP-binding protein [Clostridium botulinum]MCS6109594.1 ABC transporter ATP-binding protein [Clostridium botulinum]
MFKCIKRIILWSDQYKKRLYFGFVCSFFCTMFTAMPIMFAAYGLNAVIEDYRGINKCDPNIVWYLLIGMIIAVLLRFLFSYLKSISQESIGYEAAANERINIGNILKRVSLGFFSKYNSGELSSAITTDLSYIEMYSMKMTDIVVNGYISAFTMVLCLVFYSIPIAIICILGVLFSGLFLKMLENKSKKNAPIQKKAQEDMTALTLEYIRGIPIVKAFKQDGVSVEGIKKAYNDSKKINIKIEKQFVPYNCLHLFSLKIASTAIVLVSCYSVLNGKMKLPIMLMMTIFSFVIFEHVESINNASHVLQIIDATMDKLDNIKSVQFIDKNGENINVKSYDIDFNNVSFGYEKKKVLYNLSFHISQNTTTAIVGPSGSGKSTICNLMARFYDPSFGEITLGGINIKKFTCDSLLSNISMVFQNVYLFNDTILNNIKFGNPNATFDETVEAAKKARCHDFIIDLPNGYDTICGDGGSSLSGGEKQRISIARAILKNSPIVILDEATASVDPENEHYIQEAISELTHGKTIIIIAHRLATIENANQILVVNEGKIQQRGTHKELINKEGTYKKFIGIRENAEGWSIL